MPSRAYHEALWENVPEGLEPSDFALRRRFLLEHVNTAGADARVLDVGCGEGHFMAALAGVGARAMGIDVAEEPLRRARARHPQLDLRLVSDEGPWDLRDACFDVVWAGEVIEHVADTAAWLSEVRRVLRSGGSLLLSTPAHGRTMLTRIALSKRAFASHFDPRGDHLRFYSRETLVSLLRDFGFSRIDVRGGGGLPAACRSAIRAGRSIEDRPAAGSLLLAHAIRSRF